MASQHVPGHVFKGGRAAPKTEEGAQRSKITRKTSTEKRDQNSATDHGGYKERMGRNPKEGKYPPEAPQTPLENHTDTFL